ncbi:hypothetical protein HK15_14100 [Acetobacter orientalis]|uniref:Uncharacterized protein n=1 Tax=Acetobacter orientalis TaxID=146474 RepID=A0A252B1S9_9PROT|nr:hypothetical protein HK15_14100 [Acetobacter orientalis]
MRSNAARSAGSEAPPFERTAPFWLRVLLFMFFLRSRFALHGCVHFCAGSWACPLGSGRNTPGWGRTTEHRASA